MLLSAAAADCRLLVPLLPPAAAASCLLLLLRLRWLLFFSMCVLFSHVGALRSKSQAQCLVTIPERASALRTEKLRDDGEHRLADQLQEQLVVLHALVCQIRGPRKDLAAVHDKRFEVKPAAPALPRAQIDCGASVSESSKARPLVARHTLLQPLRVRQERQ